MSQAPKSVPHAKTEEEIKAAKTELKDQVYNKFQDLKHQKDRLKKRNEELKEQRKHMSPIKKMSFKPESDERLKEIRKQVDTARRHFDGCKDALKSLMRGPSSDTFAGTVERFSRASVERSSQRTSLSDDDRNRLRASMDDETQRLLSDD